jgi:5'-phosphate synthase pdxT subunit
MDVFGLREPLKERIAAGWPVWGTCAGMICLARKVENTEPSPLHPLAVLDIEVRRNAFGRQVDSFETDLAIPVLGPQPFHAVFIRAPWISRAGEGVRVLATLADGTIVAAQQRNKLVTSFHPELTEDMRLHQYFLSLAATSAAIRGAISAEAVPTAVRPPGI